MLPRLCIGLALGVVGLMASQPLPVRNQAWVLALDGRGGLVSDLTADEIEIRIDGKVCPLIEVKTPLQMATMPQSWVLLFEPIRDTTTRAIAFTAATDFLTKVPDGDRVLIVARGKDTLECLVPSFSANRSLWAKAMAKVPAMLPETLSGIPTGHLGGQGFDPTFVDNGVDGSGQEQLNALLARFKAKAEFWAGGTSDQKGRGALDRLNLNDSMLVSSLVQITGREMKSVEHLLELITPITGQKHLIVFSRCESDDLSHPSVRAAMNQKWEKVRIKGDLGGPAETATLAVRDVTIQQIQLKEKAIRAGVVVYSIAGPSPNILGNLGAVALDTGGYCFPLRPELEAQFGQAIQLFASRHLVKWSEIVVPTQVKDVDITVKRKGIKIIAIKQR